MRTIDLNADVGEGYEDEPLMALVTSVNIACGGHAGDDETMALAVSAALHRGCALGAHPGYPDRESLGRRALSLPSEHVSALVADQIRALVRIAGRDGATVRHVKPHGALYNQAAVDPGLARAVAAGVREADPSLRLVGLAGSELLRSGTEAGLAVAAEAFADRRYRSDGTLAARDLPGAVIIDPEEAAEQARAIARGEPVATLDRDAIEIVADTICLHGDTPGAVENARAVRAALERAGFGFAALG